MKNMHHPNTSHSAHLSGNLRRPVISRGILTILALVVSMHTLRAEDPCAAERAAWLADISTPTWWTTVTITAGDPTPLVLPPGKPTPPSPAIKGCLHRAEFRQFLAYPLLNHRNAIRLFGLPTLSAQQPAGWVIEWRRAVLVEVSASADPTKTISTHFQGVRVLIAPNGRSFTWEALDLLGAAPQASDLIL